MSVHKKSMCTMATLFPHAQAKKKKKNYSLLSSAEFFGLVSGLLCGFWDVVQLDILLKPANSG